MFRDLCRKGISIVTSVALAVAFVPVAHVATGGSVEPALAASKPTITVTRAASGKLIMKKGDTYKLGAKVSKGKLQYKSSKPKVVQVNKKGKLKAKKNGKAVITVKGKGTKKLVKVTVVAKKKFKKVKKIKLKVANKTLTVGQKTRTSLIYTPKKASNKNVLYKSTKPTVATVDAYGKIVAKAVGTTKIIATSCEKKNAKSNVTITVVPKKTNTETEETDGYEHSTSLDKYNDDDDGVELEENTMRPMELDPNYNNKIEYQDDVKNLKGVNEQGVDWKQLNNNTLKVDPDTMEEEIFKGDRVVFEPTDEHPHGNWFVVTDVSEDGKTLSIADPATYEPPADAADDQSDGGADDGYTGDEYGDDPDEYDDEYGDDPDEYDDEYSDYDDEIDEETKQELQRTIPFETVDVETQGECLVDEITVGDENNDTASEDEKITMEVDETNEPLQSSAKQTKPLKKGAEGTLEGPRLKFKYKKIAITVQPTLDVKVDIDKWKLNEFYFVFNKNLKIEGTFKASDIEGAPKFEVNKKLCSIPFATSVPGLDVEIALWFTASADGEVKVSVTGTESTGVSYKHDSVKPVVDLDITPSLDVSVKFKAGLNIAGALRLFTISLADVAVGGEFTLKFPVQDQKKYPHCQDGIVSFEFGLYIAKNKCLLKKLGVGIEFLSPEFKVKTFHWEDGKLVNFCSYKTGTAEGYIKDASNGEGIKATIKVYKDGKEYKTKVLQANDGWYKFEGTGGTYTLKISHPSYLSDEVKVTIKTDKNVHVGTTPLVSTKVPTGGGTSTSTVSNNTYRIVLIWGKNPEDLDSHYIATADGTHVYYENMNEGAASLDTDDTSSYGPETITVSNLGEGFKYCVHDYSNADSESASTALSYSGANVKVYKGTKKIREYNVPKRKGGTVWNVFKVDKNGNFTDINTFSYQPDASEVGM